MGAGQSPDPGIAFLPTLVRTLRGEKQKAALLSHARLAYKKPSVLTKLTRLPLGRKTRALADEVMASCFENGGETPRGVQTAPLARRR